MREIRTEVLVVGAGPVGLCTALLLAEAGLETVIIDREQRTAARSYACALHPASLELLDRLGVTPALLDLGRRIPKVGFYEGTARRAELDFSRCGGRFPFLLLLPQSELESALEQRLRQTGTGVTWNCRFADVTKEGEDELLAQLEELGGTSTGYIVPHWELTVKHRLACRTQFVVGADGVHSLVRERAGIGLVHGAGVERFAAYEFLSDQAGEDEIRVVLEGQTTNVLWPLPERRFRWTFQLTQGELAAEFPEKERRAVRVAHLAVDERIRQHVQRLAAKRAPWFQATVKEIAWCTEVAFEHQVAREFGRDRCWLAGDAAHQTGPAGVQSMNAGFAEAETLVRHLRACLRDEAPLARLTAYSDQQVAAWRGLLGLAGGLKPRADTDAWVRDHAARLLPCLPATGAALAGLANQLKLDLDPG